MKKGNFHRQIFLEVLIILFGHNVSGQYSWLQKNNFTGVPRDLALSFSINGKGYMGGGWDGVSANAFSDFWEYDPVSDSWSQMADMGGGIRNHGANFSLNGKGYIGDGITGPDATILQDFWQYDPTTNTWTQKNNMPGSAGRWGPLSVVMNNVAYFGFGNTAQLSNPNLQNDFWKYNDATDTWTELASFPSTARLDPTGFSLDSSGSGGTPNTVYVGFGWDGTNDDNDLWAYNVTNNSWAQKQSFPGAGRTGAVSFDLNGLGFVGTGGQVYSPSVFQDFYAYIPVNNSWISIASYPPGGYAAASSFVIGNAAYVMCGSNGTRVETEVYELVISNVYDTITKSICQGQTYDGYDTSGTYVDTFVEVNGTDSIATIYLTVLPQIMDTIKTRICLGQSFDGYNQTGIYIDTFTASNSCDSIRTLNLTVSSPIRDTFDQSICFGKSYMGYDTTGIFIDTFIAIGGCDSIRTLNLIVLPQINDTINKIICQGNSYDGHTIKGNYIDTFLSFAGCDSIRLLNLTIATPTATAFSNTILCAGGNTGMAWVVITADTGVYSYEWSNGNKSDTSINLDEGNYTVTVTDGNGCSASASVTVPENPAIVVQAHQVLPCANDTIGAITVEVNGGEPPLHFAWSNGSTMQNISGLAAGIYTVTITDSNNCKSILTDTMPVENFNIAISCSPDTAIIQGDSVELSAQGTGLKSIIWSPPSTLNDSTAFSVIAKPDTTIVYHVIATSDSGCLATDSISITVIKQPLWFVPNAFSPNGDGRNDLFNIILVGAVNVVSFKIFDRWGELIFEQKGNGEGWDGTYKGKAENPGTYVYLAELQYTNSSNSTKSINLKGAFSLIR